MKLKPWIHSALHIGCVALLLLQAHRIQQIQKLIGERFEAEATQRTWRDRIVKANYLRQGFSGATVLSTTLPPLECSRWVDPESQFDLTKTYFCLLPEMLHATKPGWGIE
jgi:hypothetical protein